MNCREWEKNFKNWLQANETLDVIRPTLPRSLAEHPAGCPACRFRYQVFANLSQPDSEPIEAPTDLPRRVMAAVQRRSAAPVYRRFSIPAFAVAVAAAAFAAVLMITLPTRRPDSSTVTVRLALAAPRARTVAVAGDWNAWNPESDRLFDVNGDGVWEIELHLEKNKEYRYQFIINGESWIPDPRAGLQVEDGFGGTNSVLDI
ncbi:MAG: isoamylase early set domain-containing protein [Spirochaetales bacterium]|nr:isoamylase early set domain-containing protein [Spirochaetales bacterium]